MRSRPLVVATVLVGVLVVVLAVALVLQSDSDGDAAAPAAHGRRLARVVERLEVLEAELARIDLGVPSADRLVGECPAGGQPWVGRTWTFAAPDAPGAARQLAGALRASGWEPEGGGRFSRPFAGWRATARVTDTFEPEGATVESDADVSVVARVAGARPCA